MTPADQRGQKNWTDLVAHQSGTLIIGHTCYKNHFIRLERQEGLPRIVIHTYADGSEREISFDEEAYSLGLQDGYEFDTDTVRFTYSSMTTPARVYDYDIQSTERTLLKEQESPIRPRYF